MQLFTIWWLTLSQFLSSDPVPANLPWFCYSAPHGSGISLASLGELSQLCPIPAPCIPKPIAGRTACEAEMHCSATSKIPLRYQCCFSPRAKTSHHSNHYEENQFYSSWKQDNIYPLLPIINIILWSHIFLYFPNRYYHPSCLLIHTHSIIPIDYKASL